MPTIQVRNDSSSPIKAGFYILGMKHPSRHTNSLAPGDTHDFGDFPSFLPQSFEVRHEHGQGFNDHETLEDLAKMAAAGAAGTAAVVMGTTGVYKIYNPRISLQPACCGKLRMLVSGAECGKEKPDSVKRVGITVWFHPMELTIRDGPGGRIEVWDGDHQL
ncbi:hypothetical protein BT96DRAFT_1018692 [Gymnopus androsaceus JB14]|uniref:Uncharacterized protein n=1 Tax=Gymnopus androsaceus JB14 TaxID=1447944 RepID=A0A6A4HNX8_9AGAR|nr:hypothetical protein BT96DRAFT_1018692 [Gymnopus androsaceus JB14]